MRICSVQQSIFLLFPLLILARPKAPSTSFDLQGNDPAKRVVPGLPSTLESLNQSKYTAKSNFSSPSSTSLSFGGINFPIKGTPIALDITLKGPLIPQIYISACVTAILRRIAPNVTAEPAGPIPDNRFSYRDRTSGVAIEYIGFIDLNWLTWQQLSWALVGLLEFVEKREANSRRLDAWVFIKDGGHWAKPYGSIALVYYGGRVTEER